MVFRKVKDMYFERYTNIWIKVHRRGGFKRSLIMTVVDRTK